MENKTTDSKLAKTLISFSLPLILSGLLQQLYNWADAFIVGNIEGEAALAAIGATTVITNLFIMGITGFASGISILSARHFKDEDNNIQKRILSTFNLLLVVFLTVITIITIYFADGILLLLKTPSDIFEISKNYLQIVLVGVPFITAYNVYAAVLRGIGDSKMSFYAVLVSAITNVFLDIVFVGVFRWRAEGAAIASVISQVMMAIFMIYYSREKYEILRVKSKKTFDMSLFKKGCSLSLPITIQSIIMSFGNLILQNFMNGFGTVTVAAITTAYRIDTLLLLPVINLGTGIAIITSQNIGVGQHKEAKRSLFIGLKLSAIVSIILTIIVVTLGENLIEVFGVSSQSAQIGGRFFYILGWFYLIFGLSMAMRGYIEGKGEVLYSSAIALLSLCVRIILTYTMESRFNNMTIAYAEAFSWCFLFILYALRLIYMNKAEKYKYMMTQTKNKL